MFFFFACSNKKSSKRQTKLYSPRGMRDGWVLIDLKNCYKTKAKVKNETS